MCALLENTGFSATSKHGRGEDGMAYARNILKSLNHLKETKTMTTESRREFEEWADHQGFALIREHEGYWGDSTQWSWEAWQAARERKNEPEPANEVTNKKVRLYGWSHCSDCWQWSGNYESEEEAENAIKLWGHARKYYKIEPY